SQGYNSLKRVIAYLYLYCLLRGMGEKPSPLGEDFSSIFCDLRVRGFQDSRVVKKKIFLDLLNPQAIGFSDSSCFRILSNYKLGIYKRKKNDRHRSLQ
ncbi:MAG: hypothetical protein SV062_09880, partial [Thermodesulfobacteriota bacterium]|nr:hypothetical protein [Thermodesulfobacteriota bacterium]